MEPQGLQPPRKLIEGKPPTDRMLKRPRLVIHCEASIVQEMHEAAYKNGRSVSSLCELALAHYLADLAAGRSWFNSGPNQPIGRA